MYYFDPHIQPNQPPLYAAAAGTVGALLLLLLLLLDDELDATRLLLLDDVVSATINSCNSESSLDLNKMSKLKESGTG